MNFKTCLKPLFPVNKDKPKSCKYATADVLDGPEVEGEEEDDEDKAADEAVGEPPA